MLGKLKKKYFLYVPFSFLFLLGLTACQESERDRVLRYDKGTYLGAKDQSLVFSNYNRYNHGRGINFRRNSLLNVGLIGALKC